MEAWRYSPGDKMGLPGWPFEVEVTDVELAGSLGVQIVWGLTPAGEEWASPMRADMELPLLGTPDATKEIFVNRPEPELEAGE